MRDTPLTLMSVIPMLTMVCSTATRIMIGLMLTVCELVSNSAFNKDNGVTNHCVIKPSYCLQFTVEKIVRL